MIFGICAFQIGEAPSRNGTGWLFPRTLKNRYPTNAEIAGRRGSRRLLLTERRMADEARVIGMQRWTLVFRHERIPGLDRLCLGQG